MRELELRRHAQRQKDADALTPEGRVRAEDVGRTLAGEYAAVFVSPANRAAETVAWMLRGSGQALPSHAVVPGLVSEREDEWRAAGSAASSSRLDSVMDQNPGLVAEESERLAGVVRELFDRIKDGESALVVGHTPVLEAGVYGLTGVIIEPLKELEGVNVTLDDAGDFRIQELRVPGTDVG